VKSFRDAEARVVEHIAGAGRHVGRLGALGVQMADRTRFPSYVGVRDDVVLTPLTAPPPAATAPAHGKRRFDP
jgi:DNA ligase-1